MQECKTCLSKEYIKKTLNMKHLAIAVLGLGKTGLATYNFFKKFGFTVYIWDDSSKIQTNYENNSDFVDYKYWDFSKLDFIVTSPGIALEHPKEHYILTQSKLHNAIICIDLEIFMLLYPKKKYIGITGTNGKSTTVSLLHYILQENNVPCILAGNIGTAVLDIDNPDADIVILECSSYQLDILNYNKKVKFDIAVFLNFDNDHIDHHDNLENYFNAKSAIFNNQTKDDYALINSHLVNQVSFNCQNVITFGGLRADVSYDNDKIMFQNDLILHCSEILFLKGLHNYENVSYAYVCSVLLGLKKDKILATIFKFKGLSHRQEFITKFKNISFINDSKATSLDATLQALKIFNNIFLILGGIQKEDSLDSILPYLKTSNVKGIFLIGSSSKVFSKILDVNNIKYTECEFLEKATKYAFEAAKNEEYATVLFSPACASFDQFLNFENRGNEFKIMVTNLVNHANK